MSCQKNHHLSQNFVNDKNKKKMKNSINFRNPYTEENIKSILRHLFVSFRLHTILFLHILLNKMLKKKKIYHISLDFTAQNCWIFLFFYIYIKYKKYKLYLHIFLIYI